MTESDPIPFFEANFLCIKTIDNFLRSFPTFQS